MNTNSRIYQKYSDAICLPELIQINENLILASFFLMKLLPAKYVIKKALKEKSIQKENTIVETSSGTYALAIGIVCAEEGIPFHIVSDPVIEHDLHQQLKLLGGEVEIVDNPIHGHQVARLEALKEYLRVHPGSFWPQQYDNPDHLRAYSPFAEYLRKNVGEELMLVASVGSGSSSCGTIQQLRTYNSSISLVGVDTFGSVLFGLKNEHRLLRGLGNSIQPKNLIHSLFDQVHWLSAEQAFYSTRELYSNLALYAGPTTGACYKVAKWVAKQNPQKKVVFISADLGYRYSANVYNDQWIKKAGCVLKDVDPIEVQKISDLSYSSKDWCYINWNRLSLQKVIDV